MNLALRLKFYPLPIMFEPVPLRTKTQAKNSNRNHNMTNEKPKIGQLITVRGISCRIVKIYPFGTLDVVEVNGSRSFRVTGLSF